MKILVLCSLGVSVEAFKCHLMKELALQHMDAQIEVSAISDAYVRGIDADVILLTPQVKFNYHKISQMFPQKIVQKIDEEAFGSGDSKQILMEIENARM